jgi:hypothetical protein
MQRFKSARAYEGAKSALAIFRFLLFYIFQASLNHSANVCSYFSSFCPQQSRVQQPGERPGHGRGLLRRTRAMPDTFERVKVPI